jgi:hypothetical protein
MPLHENNHSLLKAFNSDCRVQVSHRKWDLLFTKIIGQKKAAIIKIAA